MYSLTEAQRAYDASFTPDAVLEGAWYKQVDDLILIGVRARLGCSAIVIVVGITIYSCALALVPGSFWLKVAIGIIDLAILAGLIAWMMAGRVEIDLHAEEGFVYSGVLGLGRRRKFRPTDVVRVRRVFHGRKQSRKPYVCIELKSRVILFGGLLRNEQQLFLTAALTHALNTLQQPKP